MSVLMSTLGWAGFGLACRMWQLGIQKRNVFDGLGGHAAAMGVFGGLGFYLHGANERNRRGKAAKRRRRRKSHDSGMWHGTASLTRLFVQGQKCICERYRVSCLT
ncbi:uncharacterized protein L969DRAFT_95987 [Mixia osmundae IAM 14324]|uniref:Uncharacterized protein n=1 Tax=Mixia osmundae (strain CBS 9802 / IAM 14324 / JCM 22182 / KY 12970) TaxID=764103 RepID=G7DWU0_MIXOS|nr:uncharacterized protein L969DRAFT_97532 [Mixia osmundae IAM 14324]XP_014566717.1 uncharacterized protein L969DRAFT_95987 [Mixia osmundae IAM 14324]KEI36186.1 hypothetical protein L969DRAFT_97532 [Mixia osmundae IAM 14324]KEI38154.1 hypothetical protein L969DRAFT_95987 [Mixia osmundae IAM 14324]GAA95037.1 hypothetical protein E5Q_01692 [Mixia osmundae IAM 14324]